MSDIIVIDKFNRRKRVTLAQAVGVGITPAVITSRIIPLLPAAGEITPEQLEGIVEDVIEQIEIPEGKTQAQILNITLW